jgi:LPXTG-motif cell wall-anchored protein
MADTFAGFTTQDISQYFGVSPIAGKALTHVATGSPVVSLPTTELQALQKINPNRFKPGATSYDQGYGDIPWGLSHLNEHPEGSHYSGDFNLSFQDFNFGKFFDRLFTIRPQSFTPGNIVRAGSSGTLTVLSAGLVKDVSIEQNSVYAISQHDNSVIGSAFTGANSFGTVQSGDPNKKESVFDRIARLAGGAISSVATGKAVSNFLTTESGASLSEGTQGPTNQLSTSARFGNTLASGVSLAGQGYSGGQISQIVVSVLGNKLGGALLALLSGDIQGAVRAFNPPSSPSPTFGPGPSSGGGGGGSGLGLGSTNTGQTNSSTLLYVGLAGLALIAVVYLVRRK